MEVQVTQVQTESQLQITNLFAMTPNEAPTTTCEFQV